MRKEVKYILERNSLFIRYSSILLDNSYNMQKKKDKKSIGTIKFYNDKLIKAVIKKSIDTRFKKILELVISIDESDDDPSSGLLFCLDEAERFKRELINKYDKFLDKKQKEFLNKKIELVEQEVQKKLMTYKVMQMAKINMKENYDMDEEMEEERHRKR